MNNTENVYCRFCAELKHQDELKDLQIDDAACEDIVNKLTRLNCELDLKESILPKTICSLCVISLHSAFSFVVAVEAAQVELKKVLLLQSVTKDIESQKGECFTSESADKTLASVSSSKSSDNGRPEESLEFKSFKTEAGENISDSKKSKNNTNCQEINQKDVSDATSVLQSKLTWSDYPWKCAYCETQFPNFFELKNHSLKSHQVCNALCCADCNSKYSHFENFLSHILTHRKYLQLTCFKCCAVFSTSREVKVHRRDHFASSFTCNGCNSCFLTTDKLVSHIKAYYKNTRLRVRQVVESLPEDLVCVVCMKQLKTKQSYRTHLLSHSVRKRDYLCDICGKGFLMKSAFNSHKQFHDDVRPFKCEICKASFRSVNYLQTHITVHDGVKPFSCKECGKCFRLQKQLNTHSIVHTESHPYACKYCSRLFRFKSTFTIHIRQHTGEKPYSCDSCQKNFTNWSNFNKHMKRIHGNSTPKKKRACDSVKPVDLSTER